MMKKRNDKKDAKDKKPDKQMLAIERTDLAEERTEKAEERTLWAQHRTLLANERNFSAWIRTGLTALGAGLGFAELLGNMGRPEVTRTLGIILVLSGGLVFGVASWRYFKGSRYLKERGLEVTPAWVVVVLIVSLMVGDLLALFLLLQK